MGLQLVPVGSRGKILLFPLMSPRDKARMPVTRESKKGREMGKTIHDELHDILPRLNGYIEELKTAEGEVDELHSYLDSLGAPKLCAQGEEERPPSWRTRGLAQSRLMYFLQSKGVKHA